MRGATVVTLDVNNQKTKGGVERRILILLGMGANLEVVPLSA